MASSLTDLVTSCSNIILSVTAMFCSYRLFQDHRAPSVGFSLLGISAILCVSHSSSSSLISIQREVEWAVNVLAPTLVSFDFLWISEDHNTAHVLLFGSCLLLGLGDWLSKDALILMTRCLGLTTLSCGLTVCLFAGNLLGAFGGVALSLPLLMAPRLGSVIFIPLISSVGGEGVIKWLSKVSMCFGCWASTQALHKLLLDVTD